MGDMSGKVVLVTGGNTGIGKETAVQLAQKGATVAITSRDAAKGAAAAADIAKRGNTSDVKVFSLDLGSFASIRSCADEVLAGLNRLDVLVNNAGGILSEPVETKEGFEATLGGNHLGHFLLTSLLIDRVRGAGTGRVVTVASLAHRSGHRIGEDDFSVQDGYQAMRAYGTSKLANIQFARELAKRENESGGDVTSFAVHPGGVRSSFGRDGDTKGIMAIGMVLIGPFMISSATGAAASVYAASQPGLESQSGAYLQRSFAGGNYGPVRISRPSSLARDESAASDLWELSEKLIASK